MNENNSVVCVIDDDAPTRESLRDLLRSAGLKVQTFASAQEFLTSRPSENPGCLVLDVQLPGISGLDLQQELGNGDARIPIIFMTGYGNIPMSVRAMKAGAFEFLTKPFRDEDLLIAIREAIELGPEIEQLNNKLSDPHDLNDVDVGVVRSPLRVAEAGAVWLTQSSAVLEERNRLANEIHDSFTQLLSGITMQLRVAEEEMAAGEGAPLCRVRLANEIAQFGLAEVRRCAFGLRSSVIVELGLVAALQKLVERSNVAGRLRCDFHAESIPEAALAARVQHELFRIAQEAIGNAIRHAQPSVVTVSLRWTTPNLILEIQDNGAGFSKTSLEKTEGVGLRSMRERAARIDGKLDIQTGPGRGTRIIVTVPVSL
jgi:signal transduction histidine kinase